MNASPQRKDPGIGAALGLIPGASYFYLGETAAGAVDLLLRAGLVWLASEGFGWSWVVGPCIFGVWWGYRGVVAHNKKVAAFEDATMRPCPFCAERIQAEAKVCRFCQRDVGAAA